MSQIKKKLTKYLTELLPKNVKLDTKYFTIGDDFYYEIFRGPKKEDRHNFFGDNRVFTLKFYPKSDLKNPYLSSDDSLFTYEDLEDATISEIASYLSTGLQDSGTPLNWNSYNYNIIEHAIDTELAQRRRLREKQKKQKERLEAKQKELENIFKKSIPQQSVQQQSMRQQSVQQQSMRQQSVQQQGLQQKFIQKLNSFGVQKNIVTAPKFKVGESVIVEYPGEEINYRFAKIIKMPANGTLVYDNDYKGEPYVWKKNDISNESFEDVPGSGSVWFFPDMTRKYFVKYPNNIIDCHFEGDIKKNT
jgi:hypothetical protein